MHVMQVVSIRLKPGMENVLTKAAHDRVTEWLTQWTPRANFMAVLGDSSEQCLSMIREDLMTDLVPSWMVSESKIKPGMFQFEVSDQKLRNNRFWMPSGVVWCHWHDVEVNHGP